MTISQLSLFLISLVCIVLVGCSKYYPMPISDEVTLMREVPLFSDGQQNSSQLSNQTEELDLTRVTILAAMMNPQLRLARDDLGVSQAQVFSAHLPPDPVVTLSRDYPSNGPSGTVIAYEYGLAYDFKALLLIPLNVDIAKADSEKVYLNLLWQERQVISQARLLYAKIVFQEKQLKELKEFKALLHQQYVSSRRALERGNSTAIVVGAKLSSFQSIQQQIDNLLLLLQKDRAALNALLGLDPEVRLNLKDLDIDTDLNVDWANEELIPEMLNYRPDLLALRAGYDAQDARFRQALLAQFPSLNIGIRRTRDNTDIYMLGFAIDLTIPIFNRNSGNISIAEATRAKLCDEYQIRYNTSYADIKTLLMEEPLLLSHLKNVRQSLKELGKFSQSAWKAYSNNILDLEVYVNLQQQLLDKLLEELKVCQLLAEQRIALQTLIGYPLLDGRYPEALCE